MGSDKDNIIDGLFKTLLGETSSNNGSEFIHESFGLLHYYVHKIDLKRGGNSYIKSPQWLKNKRATINPTNEKYDSCFQYAITVALYYQNIKRDHQRISKIIPFINQYNRRNIYFPSEQKNWKIFERNNKTIALNILFVPYNAEQIELAYKSKHNNEYKNKVILLAIIDDQKWHYLVVISLSALFRGITLNHHGDFYCLKYYHSYSTKNSLKEHEEKCNKHDYCCTEMIRKKWFQKNIKIQPWRKIIKDSIFCFF